VENPQPGMTVLEKTDEEIWRAIRDLDPDQPSYTKGHGLRDCNSGCLRCVVLPDFRGLQLMGKIVGGSPTMTQEFSKPAATLLRAREQFAAEPTFTIARTNGSLEALKKLEKWKRVKSRWTQMDTIA